MSLLLAGCMPNKVPKVPVSAIFIIGFAKGRDKEAAACWVVWNLSVGA